MSQSKTTHQERDFTFKPLNGILGAAAAATIGLGYLLLSQGSTALAPVLLVVGYVVLVPLTFLL